MREMGLAMSVSELGVTEGMLAGIADATLAMDGGYHAPDHDEIVAILRESL